MGMAFFWASSDRHEFAMLEILQQEGWPILGALSILGGLLLALRLLEVLAKTRSRDR